jgi:Flp pilus assembly protein TadD
MTAKNKGPRSKRGRKRARDRSAEPERATSDTASAGVRAVAVAALLAFALTAVVFWPSVENEFISDWDDSSYVVDNSRVTGGLTAIGLRWAFTANHAANYHPITWLSHMLDSEFYDLDPRGHHRTSVLLHAANAALLLCALALAFAIRGRADTRVRIDDFFKIALVVALFALHPLRVESVAWVSERKDVLCAFFFFAMLAGYALYARQPSPRRFYLGVFLPLLLGLMAKPMLVTAPFLLLLLDYWPLERVGSLGGTAPEGKLSLRALAIEKAPLLVLVAGSVFATFAAQIQAGAVPDLAHTSFGLRAANALVAYTTYLEQLVWPTGLAAFYPHLADVHPAPEVWAKAAIPALVFVVANAAALVWWRKAPYLAVGLGFYAIAILPVIGLVQVGAQGWADRYTYLPLLGPTWALVWGAHAIARRFVARSNAALGIVLALGAVACIVFVPLTRAQISTWQDRDRVWTRALDVVPRNYRAAQKLGALRYEQGRYAEAIEVLERADAIVPGWAPTQQMLAIAYRAAGRYDEAEKALEVARKAGASDSAIQAERAEIALAEKDYAAAIADLELLVSAKPRDATAQFNLGKALAGQGRVDEALGYFQKASELRPDDVQLRLIVGQALERTGRNREAILHYRALLERNPESSEAAAALERLGAS